MVVWREGCLATKCLLIQLETKRLCRTGDSFQRRGGGGRGGKCKMWPQLYPDLTDKSILKFGKGGKFFWKFDRGVQFGLKDLVPLKKLYIS